MNRQSLALRAAAVALGLAAAGGAHAANDTQSKHLYVQPPAYMTPQPVYVQPYPGYGQPQPVYGHPQPVYGHPQPVYGHGRPVYVHPQPVFVPQHGYRGGHRRGPWGDHDGDGVPNLHDPDHQRNQWRYQEDSRYWYRY